MTKRNNGLVRAVLSTLTSSGKDQNITGGHKIDILKALSPTDSKAFSPTNPGDLGNYRSANVIDRIPDKVDADTADSAAIESNRHAFNIENTVKLLKAKGNQALTDAKAQEAFRGYQGKVATAEFRKVRANGRLVNQLQGLRSEYLKTGVAAHNADRKTENRIAELKARFLGK